MTDNRKQYILTISCDDTYGIVAAVSGFLAYNGGFVVESAQFGDSSTNKFFMRTEFYADNEFSDSDVIIERFTPIAEEFKMDWQLNDVEYKPRVMIMVTKEGHCLNHILHKHSIGSLHIDITAIVSNHETLKDMAAQYNIPFHYLPVTKETKAEQEKQVFDMVEDLEIDLVVLARYMQILSPDLCKKLQGRAINIHHSFLPGFKGANPYRQAYDRGVKIIGATAHYVTPDLDEGPIIEQEILRVDHTKKPEDLKLLGQDIESQVLSHAVRYHVEHRVLSNGQKTVVFK